MIELAHVTVAQLEDEGRAPGSRRSRRARSPRRPSTSAPRWCCCVADRTLRVCALYPDLMNIYADRGNLTVFERRCAWRGHGLRARGRRDRRRDRPGRARPLLPRRRPGPRPGAVRARPRDGQARRAARRGGARRGRVRGLRRASSCSATATSWRTSGCPASASSTSTRARGRPAAARQHRHRARPARRPGDARGLREPRGAHLPRRGRAPLGRVLEGNGNNGRDGTEGVRGGPHGTVVGTYMHGPLLPKNTAFADWLTRTALGLDALPPLDDALEDAAHAGGARGRRRRRSPARQADRRATPQKRIAAIAMPCAQATKRPRRHVDVLVGRWARSRCRPGRS